MRTIIFFLVGFSFACAAQEQLSPCEVIMADYPLASPVVVASDNSKYLVRLTPDQGGKTVGAIIFAWDGKSYTHKTNLDLSNRGYPNKVVVSDSGNLVTIGNKNAATNIDEINIYSLNGDLIKTIASIQVSYPDNSQGCQLRKPWICWRHPLDVRDGHLHLLDLNGHEISINLANGQYKKSEATDHCGN